MHRVSRRALLVTLVFSSLFCACYGQTSSIILSSGATATSGTVSLGLNLSSLADSETAALQWKLTYPAGNVIAISAAAGQAAINAGKTLSCFPDSGTYTCMLSGLNANTVSDGVVAVVDL